MTTKVGKVTCKKCNKVFENDVEWARNTTCDRPEECRCPEVEKTMRRAQQAIDKAKVTAGYKVTTKEEHIFTNRDPAADQVWVDVSPLFQMEIVKLPKRK